MDSNNGTTVRNALANGDLAAVLNALSPDERVDYTQVGLVPGQPDGTVTLVRVGRVSILAQPDGSIDAYIHESEDDARACYAEESLELGEQVIQQNDAARLIQTDPRAQQLLLMGAPPELIVSGIVAIQQARARAALGAPVSDLDGPTVELPDSPGFYM